MSTKPVDFNPETHVIRRRKGKNVPVDRQILRWRERRKAALKAAQEAETPRERFMRSRLFT